MKTKGVPLVIFLVLVANEVFDSFAQLCFKKTATIQEGVALNSVEAAFKFASISVTQVTFWLGLLAVSLVFVSWSTVLSKVDLSVATPITSSSYVFVALTSLIFLHEHISLQRWAGIFFILLGVAAVSFSVDNKEAAPRDR